VAPLNYCGKSQGLLLAPSGMARTLTPDELNLVSTLARILACALHPPRWSDDRKPAATPVTEALVAATPDTTASPSVEPAVVAEAAAAAPADEPAPIDLEVAGTNEVMTEAAVEAEAEIPMPQPETPATMPPAERTDRRRRRRQKKGA
jgi:hypothetical protein